MHVGTAQNVGRSVTVPERAGQGDLPMPAGAKQDATGDEQRQRHEQDDAQAG